MKQELKHIVLDYSGTIAINAALIKGEAERLKKTITATFHTYANTAQIHTDPYTNNVKLIF